MRTSRRSRPRTRGLPRISQVNRRVHAIRFAIVKSAWGATAPPSGHTHDQRRANPARLQIIPLRVPRRCVEGERQWRLVRARRAPVRSRRIIRSAILTRRRSRAVASQNPAPHNPGGKMRFVVQMHRATRLHYDFRLEADGVLASWAVPKGPTLAPGDRRLAMHVEDHPLDYRDFEGNIPAGQYGAGNVIVWDRGTYSLAEGNDPADEIANGKIKFVLRGKKLNGEFTLVKIKAARGRARRAVAADQGSGRVFRSELRAGRTPEIGEERQDARRRRGRPSRPYVAVETERAPRHGSAAARERQARSGAASKGVDARNAR